LEKARLTPSSARAGRRRKLWFFAAVVLAAAFLFPPIQTHGAERGLAAIRLEGGNTLSAGDEILIGWDPMPADTEEFELLLRCDLPGPLTVRLTESQDPRSQGFLWRVPNVPCLRARLLLRRGEEGEESLWAESEVFQIRPDRGREIHQVTFVRGELWLPEGGRRCASAGWGERAAVASGLGRLPAGALTPASKVASPGSSPVRARLCRTRLAPSGPDGPLRSRRSLTVQLRI
jgi:hypothetical protein